MPNNVVYLANGSSFVAPKMMLNPGQPTTFYCFGLSTSQTVITNPKGTVNDSTVHITMPYDSKYTTPPGTLANKSWNIVCEHKK